MLISADSARMSHNDLGEARASVGVRLRLRPRPRPRLDLQLSTISSGCNPVYQALQPYAPGPHGPAAEHHGGVLDVAHGDGVELRRAALHHEQVLLGRVEQRVRGHAARQRREEDLEG